jgi:hypothetical protein
MQKTGQFLFLFERELDDYLGVKVLLPHLLSALSPMMFPIYCHMCPLHALLKFIHIKQIFFKVLSIVPMCPHILPHSITFYHIFLAQSLSLLAYTGGPMKNLHQFNLGSVQNLQKSKDLLQSFGLWTLPG